MYHECRVYVSWVSCLCHVCLYFHRVSCTCVMSVMCVFHECPPVYTVGTRGCNVHVLWVSCVHLHILLVLAGVMCVYYECHVSNSRVLRACAMSVMFPPEHTAGTRGCYICVLWVSCVHLHILPVLLCVHDEGPPAVRRQPGLGQEDPMLQVAKVPRVLETLPGTC